MTMIQNKAFQSPPQQFLGPDVLFVAGMALVGAVESFSQHLLMEWVQ